MPGDIIPYLFLSLCAVIFILKLFYQSKVPVLKIALELGFSYQYLYSVLHSYRKHVPWITIYLRETSQCAPGVGVGGEGAISNIREPYTSFQSGYIRRNKRPCFMCKFFGSAKAPPVGFLPLPRAAT
jgi:hypothetical protein